MLISSVGYWIYTKSLALVFYDMMGVMRNQRIISIIRECALQCFIALRAVGAINLLGGLTSNDSLGGCLNLNILSATSLGSLLKKAESRFTIINTRGLV